jgi:hypothetical protein
METPLGKAIERVVQAAGELTGEGVKLLLKDKEGEEVRVFVVEYDEEAKVFLARRDGLQEGGEVKPINPRKFKLGMLNNLSLATDGYVPDGVGRAGGTAAQRGHRASNGKRRGWQNG